LRKRGIVGYNDEVSGLNGMSRKSNDSRPDIHFQLHE